MSDSPALDPSYNFRYPIGECDPSATTREANVATIAALPSALGQALAGLNDSQLDTPYRDGGWTVRQVVHHVADSHMNAYVRLRLALTEDWPTIRPYEEARWAELADARTLPVAVSLSLLTALHRRWVTLLESLEEAEWRRGYVHPESGPTTLESMAALYGWHCRHHTAHVTGLRKRMGW